MKKLGIIFRQIRTLAQYRFILNLFCVNSFRGVFWMGELDTWIIDCLSPIGHQFKLFYSVYLSEPSTPWFLHADLSVKLIISFFKLVNFGVLSIDICFFFSFSFFVFLFVVNLGSLTLQLAGSPYDLYSNYINAMYVCCLQYIHACFPNTYHEILRQHCWQHIYNVRRKIRYIKLSQDSWILKLWFTQLWLHPSYEKEV